MKKLALSFTAVFAAACASGPEVRDDAEKPSASEQQPAQTPPSAAAAKPAYPETMAQQIVETVHGTQVADPYRWLEDEKAEPVQAWMTVQDEFARAMIRELPGRDALAKRFRELFYVDSIGVPTMRLLPSAKKGEAQQRRFFYARTHADREKAIVYVKDGEDGKERVLLDPNGWSKDGTISLGAWFPSWDGKKVVFKQKPNAADESTLHVIDVDSLEWSKIDVIPGGKYANPSWLPDSSGFYYEWLPTDPNIKVDERPGYTEIRFHKLGTDPAKDVQVHPRTGDPKTFLAQHLSKDGRYLVVYVLRGWSENDVYMKRLGKGVPTAGESGKGFELIAQGKGAKYSVHPWKDDLYILTDEGAPKQRIFKVAAKSPARANWKEIVAEDKEASLEDFNIVGGHLSLQYLKNAASELRLHTPDGKFVRNLALPSIGSASNAHGLDDVDDAYFQFSSFTTPRQVYRTSIKEGAPQLWAKVELPIDPSPYTVEQVWYPSKDGTQVSMFLVHRKDLKRDGKNPVLLYGYGGFNVSLTPSFRSSLYPWLEAGGVYAMPNLRGGGEYGKAWHEAGRLDRKQNVFDDFIGAGEWLVKEGYTQPAKLAIWGGSNGGLLVGAAMVQRPELFGAVVCAVPLLDMVRYHQFGSGRTWIPEYGTAEDPKQFEYIYAYSPYHHVKPGTEYPALLMLAADHDDRVDPMHARKFTAAVQAASTSSKPAIIRIERNAGHGGADQVKQAIEQYADQYAFLFQVLGVKPGAGNVTAAQEGK